MDVTERQVDVTKHAVVLDTKHMKVVTKHHVVVFREFSADETTYSGIFVAKAPGAVELSPTKRELQFISI